MSKNGLERKSRFSEVEKIFSTSKNRFFRWVEIFFSDRLKMQLIQKDADMIALEADVKHGQAKVKVSNF